MMQELEHFDQQFKTASLCKGDILLALQIYFPVFYFPLQDMLGASKFELIADAVCQGMLFVDEWSCCVYLVIDFIGKKGAEHFFVSIQPEGENSLDKVDDKVAGLDMALLPQEMNKHVPAVMQFIQFGRNIAEFTFRSDFVEENWHKFGKLFGQIINWFYGMVQ